jgi:hypothetical protein
MITVHVPAVCLLLPAALQRVLRLCLELLESAGSQRCAQQQHFVEHFVLLVVAAPGMAAAAPAPLKVGRQRCHVCVLIPNAVLDTLQN